MLQPTEKTITGADGVERTYLLHKIPAIPMRKIVAIYPVANMPKLGDYPQSEAIALELLSYVKARTADGHEIQLSNSALINNHVPDVETLFRLEAAMLEYNISFFSKLRNSGSLTDWAATSLPKILSTLTASLQASSQTEKQP